ncbi:fels-2 prophage Pin [Burkholderia sp. YI23]|nr:fels-2 prophage Pin [Burkholderia sp. YI23]
MRNVIPEKSQTSVAAGAASLNDGFPPATMQPKTHGGVPPDGRDFNGTHHDNSYIARLRIENRRVCATPSCRYGTP